MAQAETDVQASESACGVCGRPAEVMATVPMCGERPRYPMCHECFEPIEWCGYAEDVVILSKRAGMSTDGEGTNDGR